MCVRFCCAVDGGVEPDFSGCRVQLCIIRSYNWTQANENLGKSRGLCLHMKWRKLNSKSNMTWTWSASGSARLCHIRECVWQPRLWAHSMDTSPALAVTTPCKASHGKTLPEKSQLTFRIPMFQCLVFLSCACIFCSYTNIMVNLQKNAEYFPH